MSIPYAVFKDRMKRLNLESKLPIIFRDSNDFDDKKMFRSYQRKSAKGGNKLQKFAIPKANQMRSEEHTSELQSHVRISYAVFCLKKKKKIKYLPQHLCLII